MQNPADPRPPRPAPPGRLTLAVLAVAAVHLLAAQLTPDAPVRRDLGADTEAARHARARTQTLAPVERLAAGGNLELHFRESPPTPASGTMMSAIYFSLTYDLFPARAFVGDGRGLINGDVTLRAADRPPTDRWMRDHGVAAIVTYPLDAAGYHPPTARLVR